MNIETEKKKLKKAKKVLQRIEKVDERLDFLNRWYAGIFSSVEDWKELENNKLKKERLEKYYHTLIKN